MHFLSGKVRPVTLIVSSRLSEHLKIDVLIASETFQHTGSFKFRATYNLVSSISQDHVITASSGNFGQAVAYACKLLGKRCHIVMPTTSSKTKIEAVREYGGTVDLVDVTQKSRAQRVEELSEEYPDAYIGSAYDDKYVIEGNKTLAFELAQCGERIDCVVAPVGGGGLTSGLVLGMKESGAGVPVLGAEPAMANDGARSLREGHLVANEGEPQTLADGARTPSLGKLNYPILKEGIAGILEVSEEGIRSGVRTLYKLANLKAEPTGALPIGALIEHPGEFAGKRMCCVISGGNVDPELYRQLV